MVHSTRARRGVTLALLGTLLSASAVVAGAAPAGAAACTGKITNKSASRATIAYYRDNVSYGLLRGETRTGTVSNPINAFWIPSAARVDYYDLSQPNTPFITTHYPDNQGSYWVNPCHYAKVTVI
jgi:hypothetical protein